MFDSSVLEHLFRDANDLVVVLNPNRRVRAANPAFRAMVRAGRDGADFLDLVSADARDRVLGDLVRAAAGAEVLVSIPHAHPDGRERVVEYRLFPVEGGLVAGIGRVREDEQPDTVQRTKEELREKSRILDDIQLELTQVPFIDPVTGVWNRLQVIERLTGEWSRSERYGNPIACLLLDVEGLEALRQREGAPLADEVLKAVARRLKSVVRDHDVLGRYGGDCFVIVAVHADGEGARALARRVHAAVTGEPIAVSGRSISVSLRIGGSTNRSSGVEILEDLFAVASSAMQDARTRGLALTIVEEPVG